jgi:hypothetical protein
MLFGPGLNCRHQLFQREFARHDSLITSDSVTVNMQMQQLCEHLIYVKLGDFFSDFSFSLATKGV